MVKQLDFNESLNIYLLGFMVGYEDKPNLFKYADNEQYQAGFIQGTLERRMEEI